jgi:molybdopterin converting factor subunit 1
MKGMVRECLTAVNLKFAPGPVARLQALCYKRLGLRNTAFHRGDSLPMKIRVLYFAYCRDVMGKDSEWLILDDSARVSDVLAKCSAGSPAFDPLKRNLLVAVNQEYARPDQPLADGDEVALFPPVSGGSESGSEGQDYYAIVHEPIASDQIVRRLKCPEDGAVVVFDGIVRNNSQGKATRFVEYHGYEPMALKKIREIGERVKFMWEIDHAAIVHRLGHLNIGESSVLIAVTSAHRKAAFEACQYAIDLLKRTVPIWKKEVFEDGGMWIEGDIPVKACRER